MKSGEIQLNDECVHIRYMVQYHKEMFIEETYGDSDSARNKSGRAAFPAQVVVQPNWLANTLHPA